MGEITYGLERLAMYLQGVESVFDLVWTDGPLGRVTYGDVYHQNEVEQSKFNFEHANVDELFKQFDAFEAECSRLLEARLPLPAYERMLKTSAHVQSPRLAQGHLGHGAATIHPARPHPRARRLRGLLRQSRSTGLSDVAGARVT